jgi:hypothetical protein
MRFKIEGKEYEFDQDRLLVREARELKAQTGMGLRTFSEGLQNGDPDAIVGMLYMSKRRAGEAVKWNDFDELNLAEMEIIDEDADKADEGTPAVVNGTVVDPAANGTPTAPGDGKEVLTIPA